MSQRGSIVVYLLFSIVVSIGAGYGVYVLIRDHKSAPATSEVKAEPPPRPRPVAPPQPVEAEPAVEPPAPPVSIAEQRAVNPIIDPEYTSSPVMGVPGIDGPIARGSVDRRMRARSVELQRCWESDGDPAKTIHATMHVDAAGRVTSTSVTPGLSADTEACVLAVLSSISFSPQTKPSEVVQPIAFR